MSITWICYEHSIWTECNIRQRRNKIWYAKHTSKTGIWRERKKTFDRSATNVPLWEGAIKKIFSNFNRRIWTQITPKGVNIINAEHRISSRRSLVYHHCESNTTCGWWYTRLVEIYSARRIRYTLTRDDIPLLSQWIKKYCRKRILFCSIFWSECEQRKNSW